MQACMGVLLVGDGSGVGSAVGAGDVVGTVGEGVGAGARGVGRHAVSRTPDAMQVDTTVLRSGKALRMAYSSPIAVLP